MREEDTPSSLLERCKSSLLTLKGVQFAGGDSIKIKPTYGNKSFTVPASYWVYATVTFTANNQKNALAELTWSNDLYFSWRKKLSGVDSKVTVFEVFMTNYTNNPITYNMNFVVNSTDSGVIS